MTALLVIGSVLAVEGIVLALFPARVEALMAAIAALSIEGRRFLGLACLAGGVLCLALWQMFQA